MPSMMNMRQASKFAQRNKQELILYGAFTTLAIVLATFCTAFELSACLSLASGVQCLGFFLLILQAYNGRDVSAVSLSTLALYVVALCFRLFATLQYKGYQPMDASGTNGLYHTVEIIEMLTAASAFAYVMKTQQRQYCFSDETPTGAIVLFAICAGIAPFTHGVLNQDKVGDITWIIGLYVETVSIIPQLYLLQKNGGEVETLHGHYIACTVVSRLIVMVFWVQVYEELKPSTSEYNIPGCMIMAAQALQLVASADFMYLYAKSMRLNQKLIIDV